MADELTFEFDKRMLDEIQKRLGELRDQTPKVFAAALNETAKKARGDLAEKAQETYTAKLAGLKRKMKIKRATESHLEAVINVHGEPIPMKDFKYSGGKKGKGLTAEFIKGQPKSMGSRSFVNNIAEKGQTRKKSTSKGKAGTQVKHNAIAKYTGKAGSRGGYRPNRLGIEEGKSVSIPGMIGSKERVYGVLEPQIMNDLKENIEKQIQKVLAGQGGA